MTDYDKNDPAGTDTFVVSDDMIRANWAAAEERLAQEHYFPDNPFTSNRSGKHKFGVGTTAARDAAITAPASGMVWYNTSLGCWQVHNGTSWLSGGNVGVGTTAARNALASVPTNFVWVSSDEGFVSYYSGTAWVTLGPKGLFHGRISYATAATVTIGRGNAGVLRIEMDGVLYESASDITIDLSNATDRQDAAEANSTWYYLYLRNNAGALAGKISSRAPVMDPASGKVGYHDGGGTAGSTSWRCIGAVFNDSGGNLIPFDFNVRLGLWSYRKNVAAFAQNPGAGAQVNYLARSISGTIPATARTVRICVAIEGQEHRYYYGHESLSGTAVATNTTGNYVRTNSSAGRVSATGQFDIPIDSTPTVCWGNVDDGGGSRVSHTWEIVGWFDDLGLGC